MSVQKYISALLMIGPMLAIQDWIWNWKEKLFHALISNLTLKVMKDFGAKAEWTSDHALQVAPQPYHPVPYYVESDWSAASYWWRNRGVIQAWSRRNASWLFCTESGMLKWLSCLSSWVSARKERNSVTLKKHIRIPTGWNIISRTSTTWHKPFVVTCAMLGIPFRFLDQSLKIKETDRNGCLNCRNA